MKFWLDAQLPPGLAQWLAATFGVEALPLRDLGLRDAADRVIFDAAKAQDAVIITKDSDFVDLVTRLGAPPRILWVTCGNVTNQRLGELFQKVFPKAMELLEQGETIVELGDA